jgi:hypothetical protein
MAREVPVGARGEAEETVEFQHTLTRSKVSTGGFTPCASQRGTRPRRSGAALWEGRWLVCRNFRRAFGRRRGEIVVSRWSLVVGWSGNNLRVVSQFGQQQVLHFVQDDKP